MGETPHRLVLARGQILGHRLAASSLNERLPAGSASLELAAHAGLQDSMPRAALLSLHARVAGVRPDSWEDPALIQIWGLRYSVYVVAERDRGIFTLGRYPHDARIQRVAEEMAAALAKHIGPKRVKFDAAAPIVSGNPNRMRYATLTGTIVIRWDGARQNDMWIVPRPAIAPEEARLELARRFIHVFGPTRHESFSGWAGINPGQGAATFAKLAAARELVEVSTPIGERRILATDEANFRGSPRQPAAARLLPSGDTFYLAWGADRELLVPDAGHGAQLWTSRVWPGALLVNGEISGTWRRDQHKVTISTWRRHSPAERAAIEEEALALPLPGLSKPMAVTWES